MGKGYTRIFFATDIHGSETCFLKFINAGKFYKADILIMGGDLTGKVIVPVCRKPDGSFEAEFMGEMMRTDKECDLPALFKKIRSVGFYPYLTDAETIQSLKGDAERLDALFLKVMEDTLRRWIQEAERKLNGSGIQCYLSAGNDDRFEIDEILNSSSIVNCPEGKVVQLTESMEMISTGFANITPWACPRDISEEELSEKIESMASKVKDMERCIFNLHAPPFGTGLDAAPQLDKTNKPVTKAGTVVMASVGSRAVIDAIRKYQPMIGLHGHIHESRSVCKVGRTLCYNPGSEYTEGILRGVLLTIDKNGVKNDMFTSG
jgi:Icc-related predicted phosphoesterase